MSASIVRHAVAFVRRRPSRVIAVLLLVAAGMASLSSAASAPGHNGRLAVIDARDVNPDVSPLRHPIYRRSFVTVNPDGSGRKATHWWAAATDPAASPDGRRLAMVFAGRIVVADALGNHRKTIARTGSEPSWSPDGREIAYHAGAGVMVVDSHGGNRHLLRGATGHVVTTPGWSPDGRAISFLRSRADPHRSPPAFALEAVPRHGGNARVIFRPRLNESLNGYDWAPDGRHLVISLNWEDPSNPDVSVPHEERGRAGINVITSRGTGFRHLWGWPRAGIDGWPRWSPDGKLIGGVCHDAKGSEGLCTATPSGRHLRRVLSFRHEIGGGYSFWTWF